MRAGYQARAVGRAFQILEQLARTAGGLTITDLSRGLGISKSTVHGITAALEEVGAVARDRQTKRYTLGLTLFELGRSAYARADLKDVARPLMEELMQKTRESVFLGVRHGDHVSILDIVESTSDLKITSPVGTRIPLVAGATGKVLLASLDEAQRQDQVGAAPLKRYTENTIVDPERYLDLLRGVREQGYATDDEEYISGVRAVAAPIHAPGQPLSAIWVVGFTPSMTDEKLQAVARETLAAARAIQRRLAEQEER